MVKIEKFRKLCKAIQYGGMIVIVAIGMFLVYWFGFRNSTDQMSMANSLSYMMITIMVLFIFMAFVTAPMQNKLLKYIILESLNGLVTDVTFNRKKGYSKESFMKLNLAPDTFSQYGCSDYYSFKYKDMIIESTTSRAFDEIKVPKQKKKAGKKAVKAHKESINYFYGRIYIIPISLNAKFNVYGKKNATVSKKKEMAEKEYNQEYVLKFKKHFENFEVYYKGEKPTINMQAFIDKLYTLKLQAKGPVSAFVRKNSIVLCIDNGHYYAEVETKNPINENLIRDYRKDVSMVLTFINSLLKEDVKV